MKLRKRTWKTAAGKRGIQYFLDYRDATGRRHREPLTGITKREDAEQIYAVRSAEHARQKHLGTAAPPTLAQKELTLADLLISHRERLGISPWTAEQEATQAKHLTKHFTPDRTVARIRLLDLENYVKARRKDPIQPGATRTVSDATISKELKLLNRAARWAVDRGVLSSIPWPQLPALTIEEKTPRCLTQPELKALLTACGDDSTFLRQAVEFCYLSGLRRSELFSITWGTIDFERSTLRLLTKKRGSAKDRRVDVVYLPPRALKLLTERAKAIGHTKPDRLVFGLAPEDRPKGGKGLDRGVASTAVTNFRRAIVNAARRAGIDRPETVGVHTLRHTCASHYLERSGTVPEAAAHLRHRDGGALLLRTYAHAHQSGLRAGVQRLAQISTIGTRPKKQKTASKGTTKAQKRRKTA